jgi:hypothetical protein
LVADNPDGVQAGGVLDQLPCCNERSVPFPGAQDLCRFPEFDAATGIPILMHQIYCLSTCATFALGAYHFAQRAEPLYEI